jgi:protein SCO1/2
VSQPASSSGIPGRKLLLAMLVVFLVAVVPSIVVPTLACRPPDPKLDDLGTVPAFTLVDDTGHTFTEDALRGHPTIVDFVFTRCDNICPEMSGTMALVQDRLLDRKADSIKLLSISVDPEYDQPPVLAAYAKRFGAHPDKWRFLTGPRDKIAALVTGPFMNAMDPEGKTPSGAPSIAHNRHFVLVDADLHIRGVYDSKEPPKLDEMLKHARFLARTSKAYSFGH